MTNVNKPKGYEYRLTGLNESHFDEVALSYRRRVEAVADTTRFSGTVYYVSADGSPNGDGLAPETAWDGLDTLLAHNGELKEGDAVRFRRGDIFRGMVDAMHGVHYGAYGVGDKPCLYGSCCNYAEREWTHLGDGIWTVDSPFESDIGSVTFDHGVAVGHKRTRKEDVKYLYDFWCDPTTWQLFIRLDRDPRQQYESIEIGHNLWLFRLMQPDMHGVTVENICMRYCGGHAVRGSNTHDCVVRGCEFGFIGGSFLSGYGDGTVRYGNAVEFIGSSENTLVEDCWIYQIFDSGVTYQGFADVKNFTLRNCLIEYCGMGSFEYWGSRVDGSLIEGNLMRFAGYGWGGQRPNKDQRAHIQSNARIHGPLDNAAKDYRIINNVFEMSAYQLVNATSKLGGEPYMDGNTYIQNQDGWLGFYKDAEPVPFDKDVAATIADVWGDKHATVIFR